MTRIILHIDMDAFFASVEAERRGLDGDAVVVCVYSGRSSDSGAVSTASYEARELGIHAGMPIRQAKHLASSADATVHFLPVDKEYYRDLSNRIREQVLEQYTDTIEQASIDESYLDLTDTVNDYEEAEQVATEIQEQIRVRFNLTCSIGIGPNKLVAKIASDRDKPAGLTVVHPDKVAAFMQQLDLEDIHGIGDKTVQQLEERGITTTNDLAEASTQLLVREFGEKTGIRLKHRSQGKDERPVEEQRPKQFSRLTTLKENSSDPAYIQRFLDTTVEQLAERIAEEDVWFERVVLLVIDTDLQMHTRSTTLQTPVQGRSYIGEHATQLLTEFLTDFDGAVRRIGVRVAGLSWNKGQTALSSF